jgi:quercetin dioxygenase-like cupin family protein
MQLKGGRPVTLTPGQTFYEGPNDVHIVGRNASKTEPAKFVVFLLKDKDAPIPESGEVASATKPLTTI